MDITNRSKSISIQRWVLLFSLVGCQVLTTGGKSISCHLSTDTDYGGFYLDCSGKNFTRQDLRRLRFDGVTTLDISENKLEFLPNNTFGHFKNLKCLICAKCNLRNVEVDSLKGLDQLESLHLDNNRLRLKEHSIPRGFFSHIAYLKRLYIDSNGNTGLIDRYSDYTDMFEALLNLTHLAVDSFQRLRIGKEFTSFSHLVSLQISTHELKEISNDSFKGFQDSSVKMIELYGGKVFEPQIGLEVFQHLPNISFLSLNNLRIGNHNALRLMKPLRGKTIDTIRFSSLYSPPFSPLYQKVDDGLITVEAMQYIGDICLSNFYWFDSRIYAVDGDSYMSKTWQRCVRGLVLQTDQMTLTDMITFFKLNLLKQIQQAVYLTRGDEFGNEYVTYSHGINYTNGRINRYPRNPTHGISISKRTTRLVAKYDVEDNEISVEEQENHFMSSPKIELNATNYIANATDRKAESGSQRKDDVSAVETGTTTSWNSPTTMGRAAGRHNMASNYGNAKTNQAFNITLAFPPTLKTLVVDGMHVMKLLQNFRFSTNSLETLAGGNSLYPLQLHGKLIGFDLLTTLNLEGSKLDLVLDFFETFPSLKNLILGRTAITPEFLEINCKRIVENLHTLEFLDISDNGLERLAPKTFHSSKRLRHLNLQANRFQNIPFDLTDTPSLEILNLKSNSFVGLTLKERTTISDHIASVPNFTVLLDDNQLSCACSDFSFIAWLQRHRSHFNRDGNYTCMTEGGTLSNTASYRDILEFWRNCFGKTYLMVSMILALALLAGHLACYLVMKRKTQIISGLMQLFVPGFRLKTRLDFFTDVFVGYADHDASFVRFELLRYLEEEWHLRTFVHSRDLRHDPMEMTTALQDSWRCLLLVTENFLHHYDHAYNIMKVASYFVGPANPQRVVVLVEESVQHQLPEYLLQVVDEENILVIPDRLDHLDADCRQTLRLRLLGE